MSPKPHNTAVNTEIIAFRIVAFNMQAVNFNVVIVFTVYGTFFIKTLPLIELILGSRLIFFSMIISPV